MKGSEMSAEVTDMTFLFLSFFVFPSTLSQTDRDIPSCAVLILISALPLLVRSGPQRGRDENASYGLPVRDEHRRQRHQHPAALHTSGHL